MKRAHKIRLYPTESQQAYLRQACGIRRFAFNWALAEWKAQWELHKNNGEDKPNINEIGKRFRAIRAENIGKDNPFGGASKVSSRAYERGIADVKRAWQSFWAARKRGDFQWRPPSFARKGEHERFYVHNSELIFHPEDKVVQLAPVRCGVGWIRTAEHPRFGYGCKIECGVVSEKNGKWFLAVGYTIDEEQTFGAYKPQSPESGTQVGVDIGVVNAIATSDGNFHLLPLAKLDALDKRLRRAQRVLSRRKKGSNRRQKQKQRVASIHERIANVRRESLHQATTTIANRYELIAVEDLQVKNMMKSAAGTREKPGKNVAAKRGLNRVIARSGLRTMRAMLEYKAADRGGTVVAVPPQFTSQTCNQCGHVESNNRRTQAAFVCQACGYADHADTNAARNILDKATAK